MDCGSIPFSVACQIEIENFCGYVCVCTQLCPTLCDPMDCSLPGSSVCGIQQARILEWVAMLFSRASYRTRDQTQVSCIGRWILYSLSHRESQVKMLYKQICIGAGNYHDSCCQRQRGKRHRLGNQTLPFCY